MSSNGHAGIEIGLIRHFLLQCSRHLGIAPHRRVLVEIDLRFHRPTEVGSLLGDANKASEKLYWKPRVDFGSLVRMMVESDPVRAAAEPYSAAGAAAGHRS